MTRRELLEVLTVERFHYTQNPLCSETFERVSDRIGQSEGQPRANGDWPSSPHHSTSPRSEMATIVASPSIRRNPPCHACGKTRLGCALNRRLNRPVWTVIHRTVT